MFVYRAALALTIAITTVSHNCHSIELTDDNIHDKITTACDSAQLLQATAELYKSALEHLATYRQRNAKLLQMWVVSAATTSGQAKLGFALLQALGNKRMAQATEVLASNLQHFLKFKQTVDLKTGILAHHAARQTVADGQAKEHAGSTFNNQPAAGGEKTALVDDQTIVTTNICKQEADNSIATHHHTLASPLSKAFYLTPDAALTQLKYSAAISISCGGTGTIAWKSSGTDIGCSDSSSAPKLKAQLKTSKLFATAQSTKQNIGKSDEDSKTCTADYPDHVNYWPSNQDVANAACQYKKKKQPTPPDLEAITLSGLKTDTEFKALIRQTLNVKEPSATAEVDAINKIYGTDESAFKKTFITDIGDSTAKLWESDGLKDKKYSELSSTKHLEEAYAHAVAQNIHNKAEKAKTLISKAKEEECKNKGNTATECGSDKCELKEGKCVEKEEVKVENDGKTTNTTGSNSFVINKAPLWLAVLLF
ncbi:uncharacterized protein TEOVI_000212300 [Trypanosoma equiperdum]|uniref:Variant surface glycoprotein n=1 Tax=Trypanosoma equiperdum TaxID=5694 RepID=A0A1G4IE36_TRYEQ|nr:hypothetical protein, conserved [Trypanosoma equiperdum]